jgi:hypothetical protein
MASTISYPSGSLSARLGVRDMEVEASVIQLQNDWYLSVPCTQGKRYLWGTVENLILTGNQVGQNGILRPSGTRPSGDGAEHPTGRGQKEAGCQPAAE